MDFAPYVEEQGDQSASPTFDDMQGGAACSKTFRRLSDHQVHLDRLSGAYSTIQEFEPGST
jgi:hypothetical protein